MRSWSEANLIVRSIVVGGLVLAALMTAFWLRIRSWDNDAKDTARPRCIERLGSPEQCDDRMDTHHRECFNLNNRGGGRYSPSRSFDHAGYLECVIQSPDVWKEAQRAAAREARERAKR